MSSSSPSKEITFLSYFPTTIYSLEAPQFLETVGQIVNESLDKVRQDFPSDFLETAPYPMYHSHSLLEDSRIQEFANFVAQTSWNILDSQGYAMNNFNTVIQELWAQEHHKHSLMEQHVHGGGAQIVGMYFLEVPENAPRLLIYDPRPGKVMVNLPEKDMSQATPASQMINFEPKSGVMYFTNSWLAHSFGKNIDNAKFKFVHFNIGVVYNPQMPASECPVQPAAEVI